MGEPWFSWSYAFGVKAIHPSGWLAIAAWFAVAVPSGLVAIGAGDVGAPVRIIAAALFLTSGLAFFSTVFWKFRR